jgi:hypothetical protein
MKRLREIGHWLFRDHPGLYLFLAVACLYFATMSREVPWGDARPVYEVALSMVRGDGIAVPTRWPSDAPPGRHGRFYAPQPWLPSLAHLPGVTARQLLVRVPHGPEIGHLIEVIGCHLAGGLLGALTAWLFFRLCLRHGASRRVARFAALALATGSLVWVYARYPFTEIVQVACFTGFFLAASDLGRELSRRHALAVGFWAGLLVNTKYVYVLCLPGAVLTLALAHRRSPRPLARALGHAGLGLLPGALMALLYNYLRFGSPLKTGYSGVAGAMVENVALSCWGFLFSPGKSIFIYVPPLLLAALGLRRFWRQHRTSGLLMLATVAPLALFYGAFPSWPGDWSWGPRYLVFAVPVLLLPMIGFLPGLRWPGRTLAGAVLVAGIVVQLLGNAFYWDHYLRIALDVRSKWLGQANRTASLSTDKGGFCEGCFEDVYPTVWLPPFQPVLGHFWLLRHVPFGDSWPEAAVDAPWRRHTRLAIDAQGSYQRARVDWWLYDTHAHRGAGWLLLLLLAGGSVAAGVVFIRRTRDAGLRDPPDAETK